MRDNLSNIVKDISVVLPCYEENHEIISGITTKLKDYGIEVIVVDDGSKNPYPEAIKHGYNFGYGAALLTGIKNATRPLIITMDSDGQHDFEDVINLAIVWDLIKDCDLLIGSRRLKNEKWYRMWGRKFLNLIASFISLVWLQDLNSGMRMFKRDIAMGYAPILCKGFSFTTSLTISMMCDGYRIEYFPIRVEERKNGKSKVKVIRHGFITLYYILRNGFALRTRKIRAWIRRIRGVSIHS